MIIEEASGDGSAVTRSTGVATYTFLNNFWQLSSPYITEDLNSTSSRTPPDFAQFKGFELDGSNNTIEHKAVSVGIDQIPQFTFECQGTASLPDDFSFDYVIYALDESIKVTDTIANIDALSKTEILRTTHAFTDITSEPIGLWMLSYGDEIAYTAFCHGFIVSIENIITYGTLPPNPHTFEEYVITLPVFTAYYEA